MFSHASETIQTKNHWAVGVKWPVTGSKGNSYTVEMTDYGFNCSCPAYRKCKHIKGVEHKFVGEDIGTV